MPQISRAVVICFFSWSRLRTWPSTPASSQVRTKQRPRQKSAGSQMRMLRKQRRVRVISFAVVFVRDHYCSKTRVTNTEMVTHLDSDSESIMMLKDNSPESTSSPISKTMSKVKSKLKGNPRTEKKNTIYTPSALSTWQALAGELL